MPTVHREGVWGRACSPTTPLGLDYGPEMQIPGPALLDQNWGSSSPGVRTAKPDRSGFLDRTPDARSRGD